MVFRPDGARLASAGRDRTVKLWDAATGIVLRTFAKHTGPINCVQFGPKGNLLASASTDGTVKIWDVATGAIIYDFHGHTGTVFGVTFSPDGKRLASSGLDKTVKLWDTTGNEVHSFKASFPCGVAFSPDGTRLASALGLWDATPLTPALREEREAFCLVEFLAKRSSSRQELTGRLQDYVGIPDAVRRRALAQGETYFPLDKQLPSENAKQK